MGVPGGETGTTARRAGDAPLEQMLSDSLYPHVQRQYLLVCGQLMAMLKERHGMMECLQAMRSFFLLEAGDAMRDFCAPVFERARRRECWRDVSFLNTALQEALRHHAHARRLTVELEEVSVEGQPQPINTLYGLTLHYEAPWPVSLVLSPPAEAVYRQVFTLLLQIKWVKHSLDTLRFQALTDAAFPRGEDDAQDGNDAVPGGQQGPERSSSSSSRRRGLGQPCPLAHRMFLLRVKFMHFVNSLHTYVLTRILHSTWLEFGPRLNGAYDLDELLAAHGDFLAAIHDRCLLRDRVSYVKQAIMKVCNLALVFADRWRAGPTALRADVLARTEGDLKSCHVFLVTILNKAVRRGSFPHLESLALALAAGMERK
uniref:Gamma-tubulin complex component n=1 Tax=Petromyzon marinus TaxID=7757 RepID=A0AAJ7XFF9_PETMA|nr:gamma-tubulin complex component 5-like [Petromyzon marinus]